MSLKMTEKKTRLLCEDDVIKAVDKHTNDDGSLQIMRKVFPDSYTGYGIEVNLTPIIINALKAA